MSGHKQGVKTRHPDLVGTARQYFDVAHVQFELIDHPQNGVTFGLRTKFGPDNRGCLFSGHIERGMAAGLRALADVLEPLEARIE
mgnify:CR=1 FL=1